MKLNVYLLEIMTLFFKNEDIIDYENNKVKVLRKRCMHTK